MPADKTERDAISLGQRSIVPQQIWQRAPAGSYTLLCLASDSYLATSTIRLQLDVEPAELDDAKSAELLASMNSNADEGDVSGE